MKTIQKRVWTTPVVADERVGMEVTSYASADLPARRDARTTKAK